MHLKQKQNWLTAVGYNLKVIIFCLSLASVLAYLLVVNHTNTLGVEMGEMQYSIDQLEKEYRDLQTQSTQLQSMSRIEEISNNQLSMVKAENYDYAISSPSAVASRY